MTQQLPTPLWVVFYNNDALVILNEEIVDTRDGSDGTFAWQEIIEKAEALASALNCRWQSIQLPSFLNDDYTYDDVLELARTFNLFTQPKPLYPLVDNEDAIFFFNGLHSPFSIEPDIDSLDDIDEGEDPLDTNILHAETINLDCEKFEHFLTYKDIINAVEDAESPGTYRIGEGDNALSLKVVIPA